MPDHLHLSLWLPDKKLLALPAAFSKVLAAFPFSRLRTELTLRVVAVEFNEPPLLEQEFASADDLDEIVASAREFLHEDTAFQLEAYWDLMRWEGDWRLKPSPVSIEVYAPEFEAPNGEQVNLDLGMEELYTPETESPGSFRAVQGNVASVLHLQRDLENALPLEKRLLWSDSGEDFLARFEALA